MNCFILFSLFVISVSAIDWEQWITSSASTFDGVVAITGAVAVWLVSAAESVYNNCYKMDASKTQVYWVNSFQCARAISRQVAIFGAGLVTTRLSTGWWKKDEIGGAVHELMSHNTVTEMRIPELGHIDKTSGEYVEIGQVGNITINVPGFLAHQMINNTVFALTHKDRVTSASTGHDDHIMEYSLLRLGEQGMTLHFMTPGSRTLNKTHPSPNPPGSWDGVFTEGGSVWVECQYGIGLSQSDAEYVGHQFGQVYGAAGEALHWQYNTYQGYIGLELRLKCASKTYDYNTDNGGWRD